MATGEFGVEMTEHEIAEFLAATGDGVLCFGGDLPYAIPVSFGYDVEAQRLVFQLLFAPESRKREYLAENDRVTLVAYDWTSPDDWQSVVAAGRLESIDPDLPDAVTAAEVFGAYATPVTMTVFEEDAAALDAEWYELRLEDVRGRHSPLDDD